MNMKTPTAAAAAVAAVASKVWVRSSSAPCVFGRSIYETLCINKNSSEEKRSQSYHCDRMLVDFEEISDGSVVLKPSSATATAAAAITATTTTNGTTKYHGIPLGRATDCPTQMPMALEDDNYGRRRFPFVKLAVVGMVVVSGDETDEHENDDCMLVTRRPSYMRAFPSAFVFPGGNVDADDESLQHALSREIYEETGLTIQEDSWKLECLWESIYPTQLPSLETESKTRKQEREAAIKAHHLVCYFSGTPQQQHQTKPQSKTPSLNLCTEEVDGALWLHRGNIRNIMKATEQITIGLLSRQSDEKNTNSKNCENESESLTELTKHQTITLHATSSCQTTANKETTDAFIPLSDLAGIYPRTDKINGKLYGTAQGSLFAMEEFVTKLR